MAVIPTPTPQSSDKNATDAKLITLKFYQAYDSCMKQPPLEAEGRVAGYCQEHNPHASSELMENLAQGGVASEGVDSITCSQQPPSGYQVTEAKQTDKTMRVRMTELFDTVSQTFQVTLVKEAAAWKIASITCPKG